MDGCGWTTQDISVLHTDRFATELGFTGTRNDRLYTDMENLRRLDEWHFLTPDAYMYTQ